MKSVYKGVRSLARRLLRRSWHGHDVSPADLVIISYPKTGRTWLRMLVGKYLCDKYSLDEAAILETPRLLPLAFLAVLLRFLLRDRSLMSASKRTGPECQPRPGGGEDEP